MFRQYFIHKAKIAGRCVNVERILYRLAPDNLIDDMCARGFNQSHTDSARNILKKQKKKRERIILIG